MSRRAFLCGTAAALGACSTNRTTDPSGFLAWGEQGFRHGAFLRPRAIGVTKDEVYVIDTTGRVQVFDHDGRYIRGWSIPESENGTPTGLAFPPDGRVLIPDTHNSRILEYDKQGDLLGQWGEYGSGPSQFIYPTGIVRHANGAYFVSEYGQNAERVHAFDAGRRFLRQWGEHGEEPGRFNRAMAIGQNSRGHLYVADTANHRIQCFNTNGDLLNVIGRAADDNPLLEFPHDLAIVSDDTILVAEYGSHRITRFIANGERIGTVGGPGRALGEFGAPRGVAVSDSGFVFVADTENHRIQRFPLERLS